MTLVLALEKAKTEEDVKFAYIKALGLKSHSLGLIDIRTDEIWFEAKLAATAPAAMFAQLLHYVYYARKNGESIPPFLAVIDRKKAVVMETKNAFTVLDDKSVKWGKSASQVSKELVNQVAPIIEAHNVIYTIASHEKEFIQAVKTAIASGQLIRTQITPDNLRQVFDKWVEMVGKELGDIDEADYALLFYADIMHDGKSTAVTDLPARLLHDGEKPIFLLSKEHYELASQEGYRRFWAIYHRPPEEQYRHDLLERRDSLLPLDERSFKGAFYTPLNIVDKAYDLLAETLGKNWQNNYIVWDMCCGVGNLEVKHSNHRNIFMSTLDAADINLMKASRTCVVATKFQYDYLNDDVTEWGEIDYSLSKKMPKELIAALQDAKEKKAGSKKILVLMNPPYAEATNASNTAMGLGAGNKSGVAKTNFAKRAMAHYGKASNELFTQFLARIAVEIPNATIAMFSKLKYVNAPNFEQFRKEWNASYQDGFIVHSKVFDGLKGNFPIGFLIWNSNQTATRKTAIKSISTTVVDKFAKVIGEKSFHNIPNDKLLNSWMKRPKANNSPVLPLKNAISPFTGKVRVSHWADNAIGYMYCGVNDMQHATQQTVVFSCPYGGGNGFYITPENLWQAAVIFAARRVIKPTWMNDRDQFLQPNKPLDDAFKNDCLIWMLFHGSNCTASANNLIWNNEKWSLTNHFIPFTEQDVGASGKFTSDFMAQYLQGKKLSKEAKNLLDEGRKIWIYYFKTEFERKIRDEFAISSPDVGFYQIRCAISARNNAKTTTEFDFTPFKNAFEALTDKLKPQIYDYGFLIED